MGHIEKNLHNKLKYLSELTETEYPFITLYLNINAHELFEQNRQNRVFLKTNFRKAENNLYNEGDKEHLSSFKKDVEKIYDFLENNVKSEAHGLAIFACDKLGIFEVFHTAYPFENSLHVNAIPHLKQLTFQAEESENALVIMTNSNYARIFNVKLGGYILDESDMKHEIHGFHKQGGWAQMRYQRHIQNQVLHHYKAVANFATELIDNNNYENVFLIGQQHEIRHLEKLLPKRVKLKIQSLERMDMRENINSILEKIIEDLQESEDKKEINYVEDIIEKAPRNSVTGLQDTIKTIEDGRAELLVLPAYKSYNGWKCNGNLYISEDQYHTNCPEYNGNARETDIIEELIRLNFKNNGKIELVKNHAADMLEEYEGIGALVRY